MYTEIQQKNGNNIKMKTVTIEILRATSDHGNLLANKVINYIGAISIGTGTIPAISHSEIVQKAVPAAQKIAETCSQYPSWVLYAPAIGALAFAFKHIVDSIFNQIFKYLEYRKSKKVMNEQSTDKDNLC